MHNDNKLQNKKYSRIRYLPPIGVTLTGLASCDLISIRWIRYVMAIVAGILILFSVIFLLLEKYKSQKI